MHGFMRAFFKRVSVVNFKKCTYFLRNLQAAFNTGLISYMNYVEESLSSFIEGHL